jgi:hypothetical protein
VAEPQTFSECVDKLLDDFRLYDRTVDLVSCWEFFYTKVATVRDKILHFDRFPRLACPQESERDQKTPDFAVLVSDSYGLVGEVKSGFPREDLPFIRHLERLKKYDRPLSFKRNEKGETSSPSTHDILLIIPIRDAQEIVVRVENLLRMGTVQFERNLVVVEWMYDNDEDEFVFRKVARQTSDFNDPAVPDDARLSKLFTERGRSLKVSPDNIKLIKAAWQFCNDEPKPIYTIVFLWTKILYHLLNEGQREIWRRKNPQKELPIEVTVQQLVDKISGLYPIEWGHWTDWITKALNTLVTAGLATRIPDGHYAVRYRNLTKEVGEPGHPGTDSRSAYHHAEYARILATYICRGLHDKKRKGEAKGEFQDQGRLSFPNQTSPPNNISGE